MDHIRPRTGVTALTDPELHVCDALFDVRDRLGALNDEGFAARNIPTRLDLDAKAWEDVVQRMATAGWVRLTPAERRPDLGPLVALTPAGGRLWEREREPDWSRFLHDSSAPDGPGEQWVLEVVCATPELAEAFLQTARACRLHSPDLRLLKRRETHRRTVRWKKREPLWQFRVPLTVDEQERVQVTASNASEKTTSPSDENTTLISLRRFKCESWAL